MRAAPLAAAAFVVVMAAAAASAAAAAPSSRRLPSCSSSTPTLPVADGATASQAHEAAFTDQGGGAPPDGTAAACQRVVVASTSGWSHYLHVTGTAAFVEGGGGGAEGADPPLWRHTVQYARNSRGFRPTLQRTAFVRSARETWSWSLMLPSGEDKVAYLLAECAMPAEHCAAVRGSLLVNYTVTVRADRCGALHANDTSRCPRCVAAAGCGWCDAATEFAGCWEGSDEGPEYDNDDAAPCGEVSQRRLPKDRNEAGLWAFEDAAKCHRRSSNDGFVLLTAMIVALLGGAILCTVTYHATRACGLWPGGAGSGGGTPGDGRPQRHAYSQLDEFDGLLKDDYDDDDDE